MSEDKHEIVLPDLPEKQLPGPDARYDLSYIGEVDSFWPGHFDIFCYAPDCGTPFGRVTLHYRSGGGPIIGCSVVLDPTMVERPNHPEGLARFGVPEDVRRGGRPRRSFDPRRFRPGPHPPFWAHCPKCNRGMLIAPLRVGSSLLD